MGRRVEVLPTGTSASNSSETPATPRTDAVAPAGGREPSAISAPIEVQHTGPVPALPAPTSQRRVMNDTDLSVFPLALGCSVFGWTADGDTSMDILDRHRELGGNFLDTADSYATGRSEVIVGSWLRSRGTRDSTVIATKIGRNRDFPGLSPRSIVGGVHASLERLGIDHIDLLYFHDDDTAVPLEESLGTVDVLIKSGLVRHLAASNFSAERLMEARVLAANGLPRFVALQTHYNLAHREGFESSLALVTRAQGMAVLPYSALAHGFLTGKYRSKHELGTDAAGRRIAPYFTRRSLKVLSVAKRIATARGVEPATVALSWLLQRGVFAPVASASEPGQLDAIMAAAAFQIGRGDMHDLDRALL